jgi:hypothetical protein
MLVTVSGALERNLVPLVASDIPPDVKPRPVEVAVSGVAFPHPEKVGWLAGWLVDRLAGWLVGWLNGCGTQQQQ